MGVVVSNTNVGMFSNSNAIGEACDVQETSNISLQGLCEGGQGMTFGSGGGPANDFDKIGGSNNPLQATGDSNATSANLTDIGNAPFNMSHCIGGEHTSGGGFGGGR
tara:strand:+ start:164 stop:484 length:321 start_codon:yes stop_codon:yes gene_type:complete